MANHKIFDVQDIARSNYLWNESKTRINLALSATLVLALVGLFTFL
jgi:hypothetical protein